MKLKVTHSTSPRAASVRRASAVRAWRGLSVRPGTGAARGRLTGGTASRPRRRSTSSMRSHSASTASRPAAALAARSGGRSAAGSRFVPAAMSLRQGGTCTVTLSASRAVTEKPSRCSEATASSGGTARPPKSASRAKRSVAWRCQGGSLPADTTSLASPPHRSRIIRVAASMASGIRAGSMPRSKRWRASEEMPWRRPVSATRTGSNRAHSTNTVVVASSQPVASPPITPASACTPAASAMAQSSGPTV